ncbi:hypothetical protein RZS08_37115 [Arthrospira platensis SPKY1]|nr:hypothetical protein [Arthrospira platensis SPKY1]
MTYSWRYERADGTSITDLPTSATAEAFPHQADAESWLGETWRDLLSDGVDAVTLFNGDNVVYGPMSLHPA